MDSYIKKNSENIALTAAWIILIGQYVFAIKKPLFYRLAYTEQGFFEWGTFCLLFATGIFLLYKATRLPLSGLQRISLLAMSSIFLVFAMEEISWGQWIFGWKVPEFFKAHSTQDETNLHNLKICGVRLQVMTQNFAMVSVYAFSYFSFLWLRKIQFFRDFFRKFYFPIPTKKLMYFLTALFVTHTIAKIIYSWQWLRIDEDILLNFKHREAYEFHFAAYLTLLFLFPANKKELAQHKGFLPKTATASAGKEVR